MKSSEFKKLIKQSVKEAIQEVAQLADEFELKLTGADVH